MGVFTRKGDDERCIFPLTGLQIGDLQSYLSDISLFVANDSKKLYILVDNRPWLRDLGSRGAHFWQLMVTKSRLSPFANTKARGERKEVYVPSNSTQKKFLRCFSKRRVMIPVKNIRNSLLFSIDLQRTLNGFIVFEVAWSNVCGINYLNQLQTDTSLSIEAKVMQRWEFDSIAQSVSCMSSWFSGTLSEQLLLKEHLYSTAGDLFYDACEDFLGTVPIDDGNLCNGIQSVDDGFIHCLDTKIGEYSEKIEQTTSMALRTPPSGTYKRRKVMNSFRAGEEVESYCKEMLSDIDNSFTCYETSSCVSDNAVEATQYKDVLILFRFNDRDLPFKLKQVIIFDLRLLTLLEAGLPSWVIFLQSYPVFCNLYRPWMCPLARILYVMISVVTVLIGLYDLYKNVPMLKATASHLCGPLFDWIETQDMVSRIKYLGTMLFLHYFQKAFTWCLALTKTARSFFSVLIQPLAKPLVKLFGCFLPILNILFDVVESIFYVVWEVIETFCNMVGLLLELIFSPLWLIVTVVWRTAVSILFPLFWISYEIVYAPIRLLLAISRFVAFICTFISHILGDTWQIASSIFQLLSSSEAAVSTYEVSMWRALWNDLFSQIFRALKSILRGFVDFFAACNRHRLSIYNHLREFVQALARQCQISQRIRLRDGDTSRVTQNLAEEKIKAH